MSPFKKRFVTISLSFKSIPAWWNPTPRAIQSARLRVVTWILAFCKREFWVLSRMNILPQVLISCKTVSDVPFLLLQNWMSDRSHEKNATYNQSGFIIWIFHYYFLNFIIEILIKQKSLLVLTRITKNISRDLSSLRKIIKIFYLFTSIGRCSSPNLNWPDFGAPIHSATSSIFGMVALRAINLHMR